MKKRNGGWNNPDRKARRTERDLGMASLRLFVFLGALAVPFFCRGGEYRPAAPGYHWKFPRDHGSHPDYRTEWWYYVGHLRDGEGKRYGFQLTFFRVGLDPGVDNPSSFTPRDLYFAHFAVSDLSAGKFWYAQKFNRPGPGLAGAATGGLDVFNEDWRAWHEDNGHHLKAEGDGYGLDLEVQSPFPALLQGARGFSRKGTSKGNASLYYSFPLLTARGTLRVGGAVRPVEGKAWMDHEFFSGAMDPDETGWSWFGLQLGDATELMLYLMRQKDGSFNPASCGTFVNAMGKATPLKHSDVQARVLEKWKSPVSGAEYPVRWAIRVPKLGLDVEVAADLKDQELDTAASTRVTYWEGSVHVSGRRAARKIGGEGYMELTGCDGKFGGF